ncbi:MAG: NTP transferase domain-containing protein [Syntrophobacteraceae bacterium]
MAASIIFAAGKGTRMTGYGGNKTLLPLLPGATIYEGAQPLICEVLENLPPGPKGIVVNHLADAVQQATEGPEICFIRQPVTNGTGGALLAARDFLSSANADHVIITMGDVPLIRSASYQGLLDELGNCSLALLAFEPADRAQYGVLEMDRQSVARIVEWKYWKEYSPERLKELRFCNAGVYAARKNTLLDYLDCLESRPHVVTKERNGELVTITEYFLTDLVEMMRKDGLHIGMIPVPEAEVIGVDTPESLKRVQGLYYQARHEKG